MKKVRIGIVGLGNIGLTHANTLLAGRVPRLELTAAADRNPAKRARLQGVRVFDGVDELIASGMIDALLICTPHAHHTEAGIKGLEAGLHVLVEKPISVQKADAELLLAAHKDKRKVFATVFNQRTDPAYAKIRQLVRSGELGELRRVSWTATEWFRPEAYYASSAWRATWGGEGGGVLLNQCPHHLDLLQWILGMPLSLRAQCAFGRYHDIEVEDEVMCFLEWENGLKGTFIASTGEAPGTSRLEIACERGRLVFEHGRLTFDRNEVPTSQFSKETSDIFGRPPCWKADIPVGTDSGGQHLEILRNFTAAILDGAPLIAPAAEGLHSLELANAMLLSAWLNEPVALPLDSATYAKHLRKKIAGSRFKTKTASPNIAPVEMSKSYSR